MDALGSNWRWDVYAQKGIGDTFISSNVPKRAEYRQAIDAVYNSAGSIVCRSTLTNPGDGCVPLNILGIGVASQTALDFVMGTTRRHDILEQDIFAATISGDPLETWAGPVSVTSGIEYRKESVKGESDELSQVNSFWAGNFKPLIGSYDVVEGFFETVVPIATDLFDLNAAVRATDYSTSGYVTTWKIGATFHPIEDVTFRITRSRDIRAPNLGELFESGATATINVADPFRNNLTSTFFRIRSGTTELKPEKADTLGVGIVVQPRFMPGFQASADYYDVEIKDAIATVGAPDIIDQCFNGNLALCDQIERNSAGEISAVRVTPINLAVINARGLDLEASYQVPMDSIVSGLNGDLQLRILATHFLENFSDNGISVPRDTVGQNSGTAPPDWRYWGSIRYSNESFNASWTVRGVSDGVYGNHYVECATGCRASTQDNPTIENNQIPGAYYMDASLGYFVTDNIKLTFTVRNLTNKDPVMVGQGERSIGSAATGTNARLYDYLGRTYRLGVKFEF